MKEIEKIIDLYDKCRQKRENMALGTVVKVEGSSYRRVGARMLLSTSGNWTGGISGGCLEGDALRRGKMVIDSNDSSIIVYDTTEDDPHQIGVGLGCNGRIEVLFMPIKASAERNVINHFKTIINERQASILVQILRSENEHYSLKGQFYTKNTIRQLCDEAQIPSSMIQSCWNSVEKNQASEVFELKNQQNNTFELLFEFIKPRIRLVCFGDNYDVHAMVNIAKELGWSIHLIGKKRKISKTLFKKIDKFIDLEAFSSLHLDKYTAVVLMTHDYKSDLSILQKLIGLPLVYLGILGPKNRMQKLNAELKATNPEIDLSNFAAVYAPVGLDIGAEAPEEIALAIAAEILSSFRNRDAGFLKDRKGSIHV